MADIRRRLPPLGTLPAFEAVCRLGSFTRAGEELHVTQAAISRQIKQLEQALGVRLFERRKFDVVPTAEGLIFATKVGPALGMIGDAGEEVRSGRIETLTVSSEICFASHWLIPRLSAFQAKEEGTRIRVMTSSKPLDLDAEPFDVGVGYSAHSLHRLITHRLGNDVITAVCSPQFIQHLPTVLCAQTLSQTSLIAYEERSGNWIEWSAFLEKFGVRGCRPARMTFNTYHSAVDACMAGHGVMLGWRRTIEKPLQDGRLLELPQFSIPSPDPVNAYVPSDRADLPVIQRFVEWVRSEVS